MLGFFHDKKYRTKEKQINNQSILTKYWDFFMIKNTGQEYLHQIIIIIVWEAYHPYLQEVEQ